MADDDDEVPQAVSRLTIGSGSDNHLRQERLRRRRAPGPGGLDGAPTAAAPDKEIVNQSHFNSANLLDYKPIGIQINRDLCNLVQIYLFRQKKNSRQKIDSIAHYSSLRSSPEAAK